MTVEIPADDIHEGTRIERCVYNIIEAAIKRLLVQFPDEPLDLHEIAVSTYTDGFSVKKVCYFLLITRRIKASFFPAHKWCGNRIGDTGTVDDIEQSIDAGIYDGTCQHCGGKICGKNSVEVGMAFWKLGTKVR